MTRGCLVSVPGS